MKQNVILGLCLSITLWLVACGGGDDDTTGGAEPQAGTGVSSGTITGFGSVFVNGVRYNTDNALVFRGEDQVNDVRDLEIGMLVRIEGDLDNKIATSVRFEEDVKGPVDGPASGDRFSVMGQTVVTDPTTVFSNTSIEAIATGDILEISGLRNEDDAIVARFVEKKNASDNVRRFSVIGHVRNLDTDAKTFQIDDLTVDYAAADVNDLPGGNPVEGQLVEVKDDNEAYVSGSLSLLASKVEPNDRLGAGAVTGAKVEIESIVTRVNLNSLTELEIGGITVRISSPTQFLFGTVDDLTVGVRVEVEGVIDNNGVVLATKVKFEDSDVHILAHVDPAGVDVEAGTVTLLGIPVTVTDTTKLEDRRDGSFPFRLADIQDGDYLEIRGFVGANGVVIATEISRETDDGTVQIRGPVTAIDPVAGTVTILGLTVTTGIETDFEGFSSELTVPPQFFESIVEGLTIVEAKWDPFSDMSAPVRELELED